MKSQIDALVSRLVTDLETLIRTAAVTAVTEALGAAPATSAAVPAPKAAGRPVPAKRKGRTPAPTPAAKAGPAPVAPKPAPKPAKPARARRTTADLDADVGRIVAYVGANPGVRAEAARPALGFTPLSWIPTIKRAVETRQVVATGNRSATTYSLPAAAPAPVAPIKRAKKA